MTRFLGLDLGGTNVRAVVTDPADRPEILGDARSATPTSGAQDVIAALADAARAALADAESSTHDVVAVGCSAPGPLDHLTGTVHVAPNIAAFNDVRLADDLSRALDGLTVFVDRDTVCAAIGEALAGAGRGIAHFVYVTVSTGLGGAIVSGGRLVRGYTNTAGEIGHWPVALDGPRCGCGSFGCAETFAAGRGIAAAYGVEDAQDAFRAAERGEPRAREVVARAEAALESLAVGLVNVLNPQRIVVGGGIAEGQPEHVLEPMRRGIAGRSFAVPASAVSVVPAELGPDVGMLGAVLMARERAAGRGQWFL